MTVLRGLLERKVYNKLCNTLACLANTNQIPEPTCEWIQILRSCEMSREIHLQEYPQLPTLLRSWVQEFNIPRPGTPAYEKSQSAICSACQALDRLEYRQGKFQSYKDTWRFAIDGLGWKYRGTDFRWEYHSEAIDWSYNKSSRFELWLSPRKSLTPREPQDDEYDYSDDEIDDEIDETRETRLLRSDNGSADYDFDIW
jgi:hypothetical protein